MRLVLVAMTAANAMVLVDQTAVPLALPDIMGTFDVGSQDVQWVLSASLLPLAGLLVFGGRLGDLIGRRRVFIIGAVTFVTASAVGGLAPIFELLLAARAAQGAAGALMLPTTVAIVNSTFPPDQRGRALGTMGGAAAVFGALGPTIGGSLTSVFSWRAVLLANVPLAIVAVAVARHHVEADEGARQGERMDLGGTVLLLFSLASLVFGLTQTQQSSWGSVAVLLPLLVFGVSTVAFVVHERRTTSPLVEFGLLRHHNYLGAVLSQLFGGMAEIGLGVIFPLLLILNLTMDPALAGLALIPTTVPMVLLAALAGRWYDRSGGRPPLVAGYAVLALSGVLMALGASAENYISLLPGLVAYGVGLSLVLTVNDPLSLDSIPGRDQGQASGVSATAEQFGGALGIAALYSLFHTVYVNELQDKVNASSLPELTARSGGALKNTLEAAESSGLRVSDIEPGLLQYVRAAGDASALGYSFTFLGITVLALIAGALAVWLVRPST
jgi:EmrB/QacA subfamily drug resistance transporter